VAIDGTGAVAVEGGTFGDDSVKEQHQRHRSHRQRPCHRQQIYSRQRDVLVDVWDAGGAGFNRAVR